MENTISVEELVKHHTDMEVITYAYSELRKIYSALYAPEVNHDRILINAEHVRNAMAVLKTLIDRGSVDLQYKNDIMEEEN